ncbi:MAG: 2-C-methyl-D-erythritol 2,4-cyclodiphosphate synthase [Candidatus Micrarchaeaceae archaeon]|jgi:2-C-methyl-D-erythritol 2,4-cyclodiphosphate synthase
MTTIESKTKVNATQETRTVGLREVLRRPHYRVGTGIDDHRIETPEDAIKNERKVKPVILSGKLITNSYSIDANSDGDVVYHAVMNALLQADGKRDIGYYFPDKKGGEWTDKNSDVMVRMVMDMIKQDGYRVNNAGVMITCNKIIRLNAHIEDMRVNLADLLEVRDLSCIAIGATSGENLTEVARGKGISALSTAMLIREQRKWFYDMFSALRN